MSQFEDALKKLNGKVVLAEEYNKNEARLFRESLTQKEKLYRTFVDAPRQIGMAILEIAPLLRRADSVLPGFVEKGKILSKKFVQATDLLRFERLAGASPINKSYVEKTLGLRIAAIEACEDHRERMSSGKLRPRIFNF